MTTSQRNRDDLIPNVASDLSRFHERGERLVADTKTGSLYIQINNFSKSTSFTATIKSSRRLSV